MWTGAASALLVAELTCCAAVAAASQATQRVTLEAGRIRRREAILRILEASGREYIVGPGFDEFIPLRLTWVQWKTALGQVLTAGGGEYRDAGGAVLVGRDLGREAQSRQTDPTALQFLRVPSGKPLEVAEIVASHALGDAGVVTVDEGRRLLIIQTDTARQAVAARLVALLEGADGGFGAVAQCDCRTGRVAMLEDVAVPAGGRAEEKVTTGAVTISLPRASVGEVAIEIARQGRLDLVAAPMQGELSIRLRGATVDKAFGWLARVLSTEFQRDGKTAYLGVQPQLAVSCGVDRPPPRHIRIIPVKNRKADDLVPLIRRLLVDPASSVHADTAHNVLVVRDVLEELVKVEGLVGKLDLPVVTEPVGWCWCAPPESGSTSD